MIGACGNFFQVAPGAEAITSIGDDAASERIGFIETVKGPAYLLPLLATHGLFRLWSVQRDDIDTITLFGFDGVE